MKIVLIEFNLGVLGGETVIAAEDAKEAREILKRDFSNELKPGQTWDDIIHTTKVWSTDKAGVIHFWNGEY